MNYLACAQEFDRLANIGIVGETKDVIVGSTSLLFSGEVLVEVCDYITLALKVSSGEGNAVRALRINAGGVVNKVCVESAGLDLFD